MGSKNRREISGEWVKMTVGCKQCGECCSFVGIKLNGTPPDEMVQFYETIGCFFKDGALLIPHICPFLLPVNEKGQRLCDIHETAPRACRAYEGKRFDNTGLESPIFEGCGYNEI